MDFSDLYGWDQTLRQEKVAQTVLAQIIRGIRYSQVRLTLSGWFRLKSWISLPRAMHWALCSDIRLKALQQRRRISSSPSALSVWERDHETWCARISKSLDTSFRSWDKHSQVFPVRDGPSPRKTTGTSPWLNEETEGFPLSKIGKRRIWIISSSERRAAVSRE